MSTVKINAAEVKVLVKNVKQEHQNLAAKFSEHALAEIAKEEIIKDSCFPDDNFSLVDRCALTMRKQLKSTHENQKRLLQDCLEGDCEYPLEVIAEMTPRQKVNAWLIYSGVEGFTDDILDIVSAAYGIILEPYSRVRFK